LKSEFRTPKSHPEKHQLGLGYTPLSGGQKKQM
jgi:hypothetical protein